MAYTKEEAAKTDEEMNKLMDAQFGQTVLNYTAKENAKNTLKKLTKDITKTDIEEIICLARAYENGTARVERVDNENSASNNYHFGTPIEFDEVGYGLPKNLGKSIDILSELVELVDVSSSPDLHQAITDKIQSLTTASDSKKHANNVGQLRKIYTNYQEHLHDEIIKMPSIEFGKDFEIYNEQKKGYQILEIDPNSPKDPGLQELITKYNATIKILHALNPQEAPQTNKPFEEIINNYTKMHKDETIGGVIQKDRSTGEKIFNEAARILVMVATLGYKQDFMLLKSEGKKQHEEATQHMSPSPRK